MGLAGSLPSQIGSDTLVAVMAAHRVQLVAQTAEPGRDSLLLSACLLGQLGLCLLQQIFGLPPGLRRDGRYLLLRYAGDMLRGVSRALAQLTRLILRHLCRACTGRVSRLVDGRIDECLRCVTRRRISRRRG